MATCSSADSVLDAASQIKSNATKLNTFVNGTSTQTVQLGTGDPTPTLRKFVADAQDVVTQAALDAAQTVLDDVAQNAQDIATLQSNKADKVSSATNGHFAGLDSSGNLTDSGNGPSDITALENSKADKVANAVEGNFAGLDASGNPTDSGKSPEDIEATIGRVHGTDRECSWFFMFLDPNRPQTSEVILDDKDGIIAETFLNGEVLNHTLIRSLFLDPENPLRRDLLVLENDAIAGENDGSIFRLNSSFFETKKEFLSPDAVDVSTAITDDSGNMLAYSDRNGVFSFPGSVYQPIPFVSEGALWSALNSAAEAVPMSAWMRGWNVLSAVPQNAESFRIAISKNGIVKTASATIDGTVVPDAEPSVLHCFIVVGQSLACGANGIPLVTTHPPVNGLCLMFSGGSNMDIRLGLDTKSPDYITALVPSSLTGFQDVFSKKGDSSNRGQTLAESLGYFIAKNEKITDHDWKSLWIVSCIGGTPYSGLKKGTVSYSNTLAAVARAVELAAEKGMTVSVDAIFVKHGEANTGDDTYYDCLLEWQSDYEGDLKPITGQTNDIPMLMGMPSSFQSGKKAVSAMLQAHEQSPKHWVVCADYPFQYSYDFLHLSGPGYHMLGETMAHAALEAVFFGGCECVRMLGASRSGTTVTITVSVPVAPLAFDTTLVSEREGTVRGFTYYSGSTKVTISSAQITDSGVDGTGVVTLTLASAPSGTNEETVRYAWDGQSGTRTEDNIPRGNLRDSAGDKRKSSYDGRRLDNWAVHQSITVFTGD